MTIHNHSKDKQIKLFAVILILLSFFALLLLIITTNHLYKSGEFKIDHYKQGTISNQYKLSQLNHIEAWMTFDYLNVIFKLPKNYLKETLIIEDNRYPNIRLDHYAKRHNINPTFFLNQVEQAIINYNNLN